MYMYVLGGEKSQLGLVSRASAWITMPAYDIDTQYIDWLTHLDTCWYIHYSLILYLEYEKCGIGAVEM